MTARSDRWLLAGIGVLAAFYLVQLASPLRIDNDSVAYLIVAMDLADGLPATAGALPVGYPWMIALLDRAGMASAPTMVLLNLLFVAAGLAAIWHIGRDRSVSVRAWTIILTLLCYPMIRETMMPHPEAVYFGLSLVAIAVMTSVTDARTRRNLYVVGIATGLIVLGVTIRIAAFSLVPPLLWILYQIVRPEKYTRFQRIALVAGLFIGLTVAVGAALVLSEAGTLTRYVADVAVQLARPQAFGLKRVDATLRALGELSVNLPASRVNPIKAFVPLIGLPAAWLLIRRRKEMNWSTPVSIYVLTYIAVLIVWPFFATRLWIPIIPLLLLHILTALSAILNKPGGSVFTRVALRSWAAWYVLIGVLGLVYTMRISLSGENFRYRYGVNGGMASPGHEASAHNRDAMRVVARYDADNRAWRWMKLSADSLP